MPSTSPLLSIENLNTSFHTDDGVIRAVRGIDLQIHQGETIAIVGESGCGKSVTALSVLRLISMPPGRHDSGQVKFKNINLLSLSENEMQKIRGNDISMIFQEPMTSLNPIFTVGDQISEAIIQHQTITPKEARKQTIDLLNKVSIPSPEIRIDQYPHELSGGMQQRASICRALISNPSLLLMDEPFSSIDALTRLKLTIDLQRIWEEEKLTIIFVTHNIEEAVALGDRVLVLTERPGSLIWEEKIELPRPRDRKTVASKLFQAHCNVIYEKLGF